MLKVSGVSVTLGGQIILRDVSFSLTRGTVTAVIGPNGAGKTTLLRAISRVLPLSGGEIQLDGQRINHLPPEALARQVAVVPQAIHIPQYFTVQETVLLGRTPHLNWLGQFSRKDRQVAEDAMLRTNILQLAQRRLGELSGGEQQRVLIARGLAQQAPLILMDEPTAHLDLQYQFSILEMVSHLTTQDGLTVILAIHDLNLAARYADQVILLDEGILRAAGSPREVLTSQTLSEVYHVSVEVLNGGQFDQPVILAGVVRSGNA